MGFGPGELIIILAIALVVFGPGKLPEVGKALGKGIRDFRKATTEITQEVNETIDEVKKPIDDLRKPIDDLKKPIQDLKRLPSEAMYGPAAAGARADRVCPKCSAHNPSTTGYCGSCGAQLA